MASEGSATHTPKAERRLRASQLTIVIGLIGVALMVSGSALWSLYALGEGEGIAWRIVGVASRVLYPGREGNLTTWYSAALLLFLAIGFAGHAYLLWRSGRPWVVYAVLGVVAAALSADESAAIHEQLGRAAEFLGLSLGWTFGWLIFGIPIAIGGAAALLWLATGLPRTMRRRLVVAGLLFLGGAVGMEAVGGVLTTGESVENPLPGGVAYQLAQLAEEGLEVAGVLVGLWAVLDEFRTASTAQGLMLRSAVGDAEGADVKDSL